MAGSRHSGMCGLCTLQTSLQQHRLHAQHVKMCCTEISVAKKKSQKKRHGTCHRNVHWQTWRLSLLERSSGCWPEYIPSFSSALASPAHQELGKTEKGQLAPHESTCAGVCTAAKSSCHRVPSLGVAVSPWRPKTFLAPCRVLVLHALMLMVLNSEGGCPGLVTVTTRIVAKALWTKLCGSVPPVHHAPSLVDGILIDRLPVAYAAFLWTF